MKTAFATAFVALAATFSAPGLAAGEHEGHGDVGSMHAQAAAPAEAQMVDGVVKKVDKAAGKVTLAHGPLTNLGMNMPMTMAFRVKDAAWLDQMKEGSKIRFMAESVHGTLTVVKFEPAK